MLKPKARKVNLETMVVTGFQPDTTKKQLKTAGNKYAIWLQLQIANLYSKEKSVGGKLEKNSKEWNEFKKTHGFEPKRGHMTGDTQDAVDRSKLYTIDIRGTKKKLKVVIVMKKKLLYDEVPYIEFYEKNKVPNDIIMALKPGWARNAGRFFKGL